MQEIPSQVTFFEYPDHEGKFQASFSKAVKKLIRSQQPIPEENELYLTHGRTWQQTRGSEPGEMKIYSSEMEIRFEDIASGRLDLISKMVAKVASEMAGQFQTELYSEVSKGAEAVGNVVSAQELGSFAAGFLEMLRKIELGVDRKGQPSLPEIHVAPGMARKLIDELNSQPPEFHAEVERLKAEKVAQALQREKGRKAKFVRYEGE